MRLNTLTLEQFSPRGLNLLGSILGDGDVRIVLSGRASHPATVVLESWTVVLDPQRAGLYDLALCARLLKHRALRHSGPKKADRRDRWLTRKAHRQLVAQAHDELKRDYPGIVRLPGRYLPGAELEGLHVVARSVEWAPLAPAPPGQPPPGRPGQPRLPSQREGQPDGAGFELLDVPEIEITGAEDDFNWLLSALENGSFPLQTVPRLEELPFLSVPLRLCLGETCPTAEVFEELLASHDNKEMIAGFMKCYQRKSEVRQQRRALGRHKRSGANLDTARLVDAVIAQRVGIEPRLFRQRGSTIEPVFDLSEHLVVLAFDLNDLQRHDNWLEGDRREAMQRFLACLLTAYQRLEVDCVVIGFADQLVALKGGRNVCLHLTMTLKRLEDDFDSGFWNRLSHLLNDPPRLPGSPTCFHPLSLRDVAGAFDRVAREQDHSYRAILWWARRGMHPSFPEYRTTDFLMRIADHVDGEMRELEKRFTGALDTLASMLPRELKDHGRSGQYLQSIEVP